MKAPANNTTAIIVNKAIARRRRELCRTTRAATAKGRIAVVTARPAIPPHNRILSNRSIACVPNHYIDRILALDQITNSHSEVPRRRLLSRGVLIDQFAQYFLAALIRLIAPYRNLFQVN